MNVFEPTEQACAAATRAMVIADIARRRTLFASAWDGRELIHIAELLDTVAVSLYEEEPDAAHGIPEQAWCALADAEYTASNAPGTGFPPEFGQYITHAVDRRPLAVRNPFGPAGAAFTADDARLVAALETLHGHLSSAATEEVAQALLQGVLALYQQRAGLHRLTRG
ncbi:hypothetical protein [Streptomyces sp. NPDC059142]|uniref:hypothetical protein n=1 Tax=Streptomyces sp. NPDC059142 TaxID=3346739 RepID=UPI003676942C